MKWIRTDPYSAVANYNVIVGGIWFGYTARNGHLFYLDKSLHYLYFAHLIYICIFRVLNKV